MDHFCDPGLHRLAQVLTKDIDLIIVPIPARRDALLPDDTATIFKNGTIITVAGRNLSPVESLAIHGA